MSSERSPERDRAYLIWRRNHGQKSLSDIARKLNVSPSTVRKWKQLDDWEGRAAGAQGAKRARGGQPGNKNACGNHDIDQRGNQNAVTHGAYARLMAERMTGDEREVWQEVGYGADALEALRLELRSINVQQLRLMTRLNELREWLEHLRTKRAEALTEGEPDITELGITIKPEDRGRADLIVELIDAQIAGRMHEVYTIEAALDRSSARKTRILQLLHEAGDDKRGDITVTFGFGAPGTPEHGGEDG